MGLLKYIVIQSFEYFSLFIFILIQFRFFLRENILQISLISLLLSFVSYTFTNAGLNALFPIIQVVIILLYIRIAMKVSLLNALIMFFTGYIVFGLAQTCVLAATLHAEIFQDKIDAGTDEAYFVQIITIALMFLISWLISLLKGGFSFIEAHSRFSTKSFTGKSRIFIMFIVFAFIVSIAANIIILEIDNPPQLEIAFLNLVLLLILFYLSIRRDEVNDRSAIQSSRRQNEENKPG